MVGVVFAMVIERVQEASVKLADADEPGRRMVLA